MKLRNKILMILLLVSLIPTTVFFVFSTTHQRALLNERTMEIQKNMTDQSVFRLNESLGDVEHVLEEMYLPVMNQNSMVDELVKYGEGSYPTNAERINSSNMMKLLCQNSNYFSDYINGIFIFTPCGLCLESSRGNLIGPDSDYNPSGEEWYTATLALQGRTYVEAPSVKKFLNATEPSLSFCTALYGVNDHRFLGVLMVDTNLALLTDQLINTFPSATYMALSAGVNGNILFSNKQDLSSDFVMNQSEAIVTGLDSFDLMLTVQTDHQLVQRGYGSSYYNTLILAGILAASLIAVSIIVSRNISRPIVELSRMMRNDLAVQDVTSMPAFNRGDEIGTLYNAYQRMLEERLSYEKNVLESRLIQLDSQMQALESQINAHFLYNTLESINSIATVHHISEISTMAMALGSMFRYSIKTESERVPLNDELNHIRNYLDIQMIRFDHLLSYHEQVPQELRERKVLKLILQPLVENAVLHGLTEKKQGALLKVSAEEENHFLVIRVADNGIGMDASELQKLRTSIAVKQEFISLGHRENHGGIGVLNVNTRLRLYYGPAYHMEILSRKGEGTSYVLYIPQVVVAETAGKASAEKASAGETSERKTLREDASVVNRSDEN